MSTSTESLVGTPEDRRQSILDAARGINLGAKTPAGGEIKAFLDELKKYADRDVAERIGAVLEKGPDFLTGSLPSYFREALEKTKDAPGWQKIGTVMGAAVAVPDVFKREMSGMSDDFLKFYYGALARFPWPTNYPMGEERYRQEFYRQVLANKAWGIIAIGIDALDYLPGVSDWYHEHRPSIDIDRIPIPFASSLLKRATDVPSMRIDLIDLAVMYQMAQETGTARHFFDLWPPWNVLTSEDTRKTFLLAGIESVQALQIYKLFPDNSFFYAECCDRVARTNIGYGDRAPLPVPEAGQRRLHRSTY